MERMGKVQQKILEIGIQKVEQAGRLTLRQRWRKLRTYTVYTAGSSQRRP